MTYWHKPVLQDHVLDFLEGCGKGTIIDCTLGEGGHSQAILSKVRPDRLIGIEADQSLLPVASERLAKYNSFTSVNANFTDLPRILAEQNTDSVTGILIDLGISMFHYKASERGFSFTADEPLDMRINTQTHLTAADIVNGYDERQLSRLIWAFGEERFANRIARKIVELRKEKEFKTAKELSRAVEAAIGRKPGSGIHPATRTFQALRIEVNRELDNLETVLDPALKALSPGGRLLVISFHSLEDRIVKNKFRDAALAPIIDEVRGIRGKSDYRILTKKPLIASEKEADKNPASRSAKLRIIEKLP